MVFIHGVCDPKTAPLRGERVRLLVSKALTLQVTHRRMTESPPLAGPVPNATDGLVQRRSLPIGKQIKWPVRMPSKGLTVTSTQNAVSQIS